MTRVAVVGTGVMGRNHVRVLRELGEVDLVGVADANPDAAFQVAAMYGTRGYGSHQELIEREQPEALIVAAPTINHHAVVMDAIAAGCHVLVEKPIAATLDEADELVARAKSAKRVLAVGHIERYNPAVLELKRRLDEGQLGRVFQLNARRLGPFPQRVRDVGVVVDLATHDLDVMRYLTGSEIVRVYAETRREVHTTREDLVTGLLRFADGSVGVLQINWLTPSKIRELAVTGERGMFRADYLTQDLFFHENAAAADNNWQQITMLRGVSEGSMVQYAIQKREPLRSELEAFLRAVSGEASGIVSGEDGRKALHLALALVESGTEGHVVTIGRS
ncbi:MAG: Gfo/Idh/MocA family oxidoreductase [Chloroflexi bacterium]|nr:MAG: Gfo/Idh/MocA family oxidoreductase [Chloroflexota bacterium]TMC72078.1 MAG: Gfo/Idh/MocA family oxidoreductase [Chloroflexota bacterium]